MASIPEFLAATTVAAGSGAADDAAIAIAAFDGFLASVKQADELNALTAAGQAFANLCLNGTVAEAVRAHIDDRMAETTARLHVAGGQHAI